jgi:Outer membrane protein beta-barrel domain
MQITSSRGGLQVKIRKWAQGFVMLVVFCASGAALHAQDYRVFVMGGASSLFDKRYYSVYGVSFGSTYKTGADVTVGAEIPVLKLLSAEGSYGYVRNNLAVTNFFNTPIANAETGYPILDQRVSADAVAHAAKPFKGVRPYLVLGIEFDRFAPTSTGAARAKSAGFNGVPNTVLKADDKFGWNFGFGMDINLMRFLAFRIDVREHRTATPTFGLPAATTTGFGAYYPVSGRAEDVDYSAGFVIHFGK